MATDFLPPAKKFEIAVNNKVRLQPIYNICRVLNLNEYQERESYECMIRVGNMKFISNPRENRNAYSDEKQAENVASKHAYTEMLRRKWKVDPAGIEEEKLIQSNLHKVPGGETTRDGWQKIVNMGEDELNVIYECGKYMSEEVFAMQFKDIARLIITNIVQAQYSKPPKYKYTTRLRDDGNVTGFTSVLDFNGKNFESLGLMVDENQAEQSAAEVCLRGLGFIPSVPKEKFLIQPYQGGISRHIPGLHIEEPYLFSSTVMFDVLDAFLDARNMMRAKYYIKNAPTKLMPAEFTIYGVPEQMVECVCSIFGKIFSAPSPHTLHVAIQLSANEVLKYFGVDRPRERMELRKNMRINRYDFSKGAKSAYTNRPSVCKGWIWPHFCRPVCYGDRDIESLLNSDILLNNLPGKEYIHELVRREMESKPSFKSKELREMTDLSVAEVDKNDPELFIIGNSQFSIKVLFEDGKVYSRQRSATVDVLPGHNIRKLRCEYRISLPSLDIHLKAIDCHDLYFDNPPLPVVTTCGAVVLFHDYQASPEDVFVLVRQRTSGISFESNVHVLQGLLHSLITANSQVVVTPAECTKGIEKWLYKEVKLLSEMTMDSLCELMSTCTKYDTRWNELVATGELVPPLKEIQDTCLNELRRRENEGICEDKNTEIWELPQSEFVTTFDTIGIHLEDSIFCVIRTLSESTGIRIRLADIETCETLDMPIECDKRHRGGVSRYYLWNGVWDETKQILSRKIHESKEEKELTQGYEPVTNTKVEHGMRRYRYAFHERLFMSGTMFEQGHLMQNVDYVNTDGSRTKYTDTLKYRINVKELKRSKYYGQQEAEENVQLPSDATEDVPADLTSMHLPGGAKFSSYKNSLQLLCLKKRWGEPHYNCIKEGKLFRGTVNFGKTRITCKKLSQTPKVATAHAAFDALRSCGYLRYVTFHQGRRKSEDGVPKPPGKHVDIAAKIQELKDKIKSNKDDNNVDTSVNESLNESTDTTDTSVNMSLNESTDATDPYSVISVKEETDADDNPDCDNIITEDTAKDVGNNEVFGGSDNGVTDDKEDVKSVFDDNTIAESEEDMADGESYTVLNEWTRGDDELDTDDNTGHKRKRVSQWVIDDDISVDDLDMDYKEEVDKEFKRKRYRENKKRMKLDDGTGNTEEASTEWAKHKDLKGFKKSRREEMPDVKRVTYVTPGGKITKWRKPRIPPLPAREAYREQVMWMKLDEALDVCPMLMTISQTTQFKELVKKTVDDGNTLLELKGLTGTVKTSFLYDV